MEIRILDINDVERFRAIRLEGLSSHPEAFASSYEEEVGRPIEEFTRRVAPVSHSFILGAFLGDELVGTAGFKRETYQKLSHKGFIWGMYVSPNSRAKGIGTRLLQQMLDKAHNINGLSLIQLTVMTGNHAAKKLYSNLGFVQVSVEKDALRVNGQSYDEANMTLRIDCKYNQETQGTQKTRL